MNADDLKKLRVPADWMTRSQRRRAQHDAAALPKPTSLDDQPKRFCHFGYLTGWTERQRYTLCGKKRDQGYVPVTEQVEDVTCPQCVRLAKPREQAIVTTEPTDVDQVRR